MRRSLIFGLAGGAVIAAGAAVAGVVWYRNTTGYWVGVLENPADEARHSAAIEVLDKREDPAVIPALIAALQDSDDSIRVSAAQSLGWRKAPESVEPLMDALAGESNPWQRVEFAKVLGEIGDGKAAPALLTALYDADDESQTKDITDAIGHLGAAGVPVLIKLFDNASPKVRAAAISALGFSIMSVRENGDDPSVLKDAVAPLVTFLKDQDPDIRADATNVLGDLRDKSAIGPLIAELGDPDPTEREVLARVLSYFTEDSFPLVVAAFQEGAPEARLGAAEALAEFNARPDYDSSASEEMRSEAEQAAKLLDAAAAGNELTGVGGYGYFIRHGRNDALDFLIAGLNAYGNKVMAERFLNAGNDTLKEAASDWAKAHDYTIETTGYTNGEDQWGSAD
jgi:HEAT repeat protein